MTETTKVDPATIRLILAEAEDIADERIGRLGGYVRRLGVGPVSDKVEALRKSVKAMLERAERDKTSIQAERVSVEAGKQS